MIFFLLVSSVTFLVIKPEAIINTRVLAYVLEKTDILEQWKWDKGNIDFTWYAWNHRRFTGLFRNFCFRYNSESLLAESCLEEVSWDFDISWTLKDGPRLKTIRPLLITSNLISLELKATKSKEPKIESPPPPVRTYWEIFWSELIPDIHIHIAEIAINSGGKLNKLDFILTKERYGLHASSLGFKLVADPDKLVVYGPEALRLPGKLPLKKPLELRNLTFKAMMKNNEIPFELAGNLEGIDLKFSTLVGLPLRSGFSSLPLRKEALLNLEGKVLIDNLKKAISYYGPPPYDELPAPLNVMNGSIEFILGTTETEAAEVILFQTNTKLDLKGEKQFLEMDVSVGAPLNVMTFARGVIDVGIDFSKVTLQLPRLSRTSPPPQFFPDGRFKTVREEPKKEAKNNDISIDLEAMNEEALHIRSNMLDEALRLNFDFAVRNGELKKGFLKVLPLKTTVFKRPVRVKDLLVTFDAPVEPVIKGTVLFPLPEYKITLTLEGPISGPKHSFTSEPPLPQNDIYAVLLFGRPLNELNPDDKDSAQQTNKILAQGILSLSVLYFFAGSPVEYVGYDPETGRATAQFGIDRKTSLKVGEGKGGGSTGVRRSLGKGWYLDTTVQKATDPTSERTRDYGVLLERIIAY